MDVRDRLGTQEPCDSAVSVSDARERFEGGNVELQEAGAVSAQDEDSTLLSDTRTPFAGGGVHGTAFWGSKFNVLVCLFVIAFATVFFFSIRGRLGAKASVLPLTRIDGVDANVSAAVAAPNSYVSRNTSSATTSSPTLPLTTPGPATATPTSSSTYTTAAPPPTASAPPVMLALQFEPDSSTAITLDYVPDDGTPRVFSPGRLLLRSVAVPALSRLDACLFAAPARSSMLSLIQATIVAQDSPQCVRTCRVRLPTPELQCPGALLQFQLPNALLLPAGEPRIEFNNGGAGFQVSWEGGTGAVLSLDAASCNVKVMQVPPHLLLPRISHCNSRHRIAGADELHLCNHGLSHPHHLCPLLCPRLLALLPCLAKLAITAIPLTPAAGGHASKLQFRQRARIHRRFVSQ